MIKAEILKTDGNYRRVMITGHAFGARNGEGHDLICSAVSALAYTMAYSLMELVGEKPSAKDGDGYFLCELPDTVQGDKLLIQNTIVGSFEIGVRAISMEYPKNVKLKLEEVGSDA